MAQKTQKDEKKLKRFVAVFKTFTDLLFTYGVGRLVGSGVGLGVGLGVGFGVGLGVGRGVGRLR